jgi:hypothetical protein
MLYHITKDARGVKPTETISPSGIHSYVDKIQLWLKRPLSAAKLNHLRSLCGTPDRVRTRHYPVHVRNEPKRWDRSFKQRLQLRQPTRDALDFVATLDGVLVNIVEIALDWTFNRWYHRDDARDLADRWLVTRHHRDQGIRFVKRTRYTAGRPAPNNLVTYSDRPSKATGELYCVHVEWRINGVRAFSRADIKSMHDLVNLDFRKFWHDRLVMRAIDINRLGRLYHQWMKRTTKYQGRRRFIFDCDRLAGGAIHHCLGSTQAIMDMYRNKFKLRPALVHLDSTHLLPAARHPYDNGDMLHSRPPAR